MLNNLEERKPEVDELWVNLKTLGWQGTGDSVDLFVAEAMDILGTNGGTIFFPSGHGTFSASFPSFAGTRGFILRGTGGLNSGASPPTRLTYTGTGTRAIDARSSNGFQIKDIQLMYNNVGFTGVFIDYSQSTVDAHYGLLERCYIGGESVFGASALVSYNDAIIQNAKDCVFGPAQVAIKGVNSGSDYSNIISVDNCTFVQQVVSSVINAGQSWSFRGCTFEPLASGAASAYNQVTSSSAGLSFIGCWMGDASASGNWISWSGSGLHLAGNVINTGAKGLNVAGSSNFGIHITGNQFANIPTAIDLGTGQSRCVVLGNDYQTVTNRIAAGDNPPQSIFEYPVGSSSTDLTLSGGMVQTTGRFRVGTALVLPTYTVATRPAAGSEFAGTVIYVSDGGAGAIIQASNGAAWVNLG